MLLCFLAKAPLKHSLTATAKALVLNNLNLYKIKSRNKNEWYLSSIEYRSRLTVPNRTNDFFSPSIKILFISNLGLGAAITITNHLLDNLIPSIRDFEFSSKRCFGFSVPDSQKADLQLLHVLFCLDDFFFILVSSSINALRVTREMR